MTTGAAMRLTFESSRVPGWTAAGPKGRPVPDVRRAVVTAAIALVFLAAARSALAVEASELLVPQFTAEQHGLTRAWFFQVPAIGGRSHLTHVVQDDGMLFAQTSTAMLYAIDAETGRLVWSQQVGQPNQPSLRPAANGRAVAGLSDNAAIDKLLEKTDSSDRAMSQRHDKVVAVVNGSTLYLLNRSDGTFYMDPKNNVPWKAALVGVPECGPLVTDDKVYVPTVDGPIAVYVITDSRRAAHLESSSGRNTEPPVQAGDRIAWATSTGVLQITQPKDLHISHRIETTGPIITMLVPYPPQVYAGSLDGYAYSVNENNGQIIWKLSTGWPVRESPAVIQGAVYIVSEGAGMFRVAATDGHQDWFNPSPRHFLAASPTKVYAIDKYHRMQIVSAKTGATIDSMPLPEAVMPMHNGETDRVILSSNIGFIQCLHEPELVEPLSYVAPKPVEKPPEEAPKQPAKATKPPDEADKPKPAPKAAAPASMKEKAEKPAVAPKAPVAPKGGAQPMAPK
jgi:outer membrane protein assembly factor BamB